MDFEIQNFRAPAPRLSPDSNISGIPNASSVLPDSLVAQGFTTMPDDPPFASFGGQDGGDQDPNQNTGNGTAPFSITINGAGADTSGGTVIPASSFTIGCNSGNFTITRAGIDAGGTSPQTLGPEELELNTGFSGDFTTGDGFKEFIVFGVVVFSKNSAGRPNAIVGSNAGGTYGTRIYVRDAEDSTPEFVEGFSDLNTANPLYMFRIGSVRSTKSGSLRRVYVTQSVVGNDEIGDDLPAADGNLFAFKVVNDGDGTVSVTTGTVNTVTATGLTPTGKPTALWLKVTFADDVVTAASVQTSSGTTSETADYRQIASITWNVDVPTIAQGIKGSQSIASCGATHQWGTLYS
tara:strand:- start:1517 stop:2566 length:1050 start_codon:yes stop_codon:yes gene_type:complete